ncbi:Spermine synthase [Nymphon striatum]|nr:Spermine synthase [Nymphon striatum]
MNQKALARSEVFDLQVDPSLLLDPDEKNSIFHSIEKILEDYELKKQSQVEIGKDSLLVFTSPAGVHVVIRTHSNGVITLILEEQSSDNSIFNETVLDEFHNKMKKLIENAAKIVRLFSIKRGLPIDVYATTTDKRIIEYDFDKILFEDTSEYQHIRLVHSPCFGNMLWLDNLQNLAEEDSIYTHCLMNKGRECYKDKKILILGGGDGALLNELLKEDPKFVTMIIVDDALKIMAEYIADGNTFDFIFNDLTDVPVSLDPVSIYWSMVENILKLAMKLLKENGKYYNHATNFNAISSLEMYEKLLDSLSPKVTYRKYDAHVPSFMERLICIQARIEFGDIQRFECQEVGLTCGQNRKVVYWDVYHTGPVVIRMLEYGGFEKGILVL